MGLPLFVVPTEPEVDSKSTEKLAAIPRSAIRRATIRPRRSDGEARRRRILGLVERASPEVYVINDTEPMPSRPSILSNRAYREHVERLRGDRRFDREVERAIYPEDDRMMPPVPESGDFASETATPNELRRARHARQDARRHPRMAPRPNPYQESGERSFEDRTLATDFTPRAEDSDVAPFRAPPTLSSLQRRVDYLNARSNRLLGGARLDGLGDRNRSLSPPGEWYRELDTETRREARDNHDLVMSLAEETSDEGGAWDTLLTSITPDPQPPSAGSSFASSSAAVATSSTTGPASSATTMTSTGGTQDPIPCDITDASESEEEDMYELPNFANNRASGDRFWRTYATVVTAGPNRDPRPGVDAEHLDGMHRIISRLASRDEIPENWWASAGLSRILRREPAA